MNRFHFLGAQKDDNGQEWCYVLDTQTGTTLKSPVKAFGAAAPVVPNSADNGRTFFPTENKSVASTLEKGPVFPVDTVTAPGAVEKPKPHPEHGTLTMETPEERTARLTGRNKVPPAFLGNISKMGLDPTKTDGPTDVTTKM